MFKNRDVVFYERVEALLAQIAIEISRHDPETEHEVKTIIYGYRKEED